MSEQTGSVLAEENGSARSLILNRPKSINAIDHEMVTEMAKLLDGWATDDAVAAVVLYGAGERGLCAGGDIVAIHRDAAALSGNPDATDLDAENSPSAKFWFDEYRLNAAISRFPKKYVAIMDGIVMGGGVGISAHGNVRIVTERSSIAMPETGIGFIPDVGGTYLLSRTPGELGTHIALTTGRMKAGDAIALGFADHYVPSESLDKFVAALESGSVEDALAEYTRPAPESTLLAQREWIDAAYSADTVEEIVERLQSSDVPEARETAEQVLSKSPVALKVTLRSLRAARELGSLEEVLNEEFRVSTASLKSHDLVEGIRAQVVDKDRNPKWSPATLADVTTADVDAYFQPLGDLELGLAAPKENDR